MKETHLSTNLSRRRLLQLFAAAGVVGAGGYVLSVYPPWVDYDAATLQTWKAVVPNSTGPMRMREMVRMATLAANGHNTQPWSFILKESEIVIKPDYARRLPVVDPEDRELWISLGCALENLMIAARASGFEPNVIYPGVSDEIRVLLTSGTPRGGPQLDAIPKRQSTRSEFDGRLMEPAELDRLMALPVEPGTALRFLANPAEMERALDYVQQGDRRQYANPAFVDELVTWLRFGRQDAVSTRDGLYARCSGNPEVPRWLGKMFVSGSAPQQQADTDAKTWRSSSGAVMVVSTSNGKETWVRTGQVYERLALAMTTMNIKSALMNQPIEVAELRGQIQSALALGSAQPQLLVRFGYADSLPRSLRRPVEQVIVANHQE